jgi:uncharacterized protein YjbI with pentapeptide repeats
VFREATLDGANLGMDNVGGRTQLQGADLRGASLLNTCFNGALYDESTKFPDKFDPRAHVMVHASKVMK